MMIRNVKQIILPVVLACAAVSVRSAIVAGDVLVFDFGKNTQETAGNWNNLSGAPAGGDMAPTLINAIRLSDGAGTNVGLRLLAQEDGKSGLGGATVGAPATTAGLAFVGSGVIPTSALVDLAYMSNELLVSTSTDATNGFTFTGLDDNLTYTISWVSSINTARDSIPRSVGGNTVNIDPEDNTTVYSFTGLSSLGGELTVSVDIDQVTNGETAHLNAVELVAIPEPSSFALVGAFLAVIFLFYRRG